MSQTIYESLAWNEIKATTHAAAQYIPLKYGEAGTSGQRVTLIAGTHGDEGPWSALAIKQLCHHPIEQLKGRLRIIFTANALTAEVERRNSWIDSPNPVDLDGVFPGNSEGSHTEQLAAHLAPLITDSDAVIDMHGGGTCVALELLSLLHGQTCPIRRDATHQACRARRANKLLPPFTQFSTTARQPFIRVITPVVIKRFNDIQ